MPERAAAALRQLMEGNQRFVSNKSRAHDLTSQQQREALLAGQQPFAVILGCSDSRVPAEIIFDQGLGALFVIRVAGNVVAPSQIGSIEYAVDQFDTRLVVVLGHSQCGAVNVTLSELRQPTYNRSPNLGDIVDRISPAAATVMEAAAEKDPEQQLKLAVRANVRASADHLRHGSRLVENLIAGDHLRVVGAEYCLETGVVDFFDSPIF